MQPRSASDGAPGLLLAPSCGNGTVQHRASQHCPLAAGQSPARLCPPGLRRGTPSPTLFSRSDPNPDLPDQTLRLQVMVGVGSSFTTQILSLQPGTFSITLKTGRLSSHLSPVLPSPTGIMDKRAALHGFCRCWGKLENGFGHLSSATAGTFSFLVPFQACLSPRRRHSGTHIPAHGWECRNRSEAAQIPHGNDAPVPANTAQNSSQGIQVVQEGPSHVRWGDGEGKQGKDAAWGSVVGAHAWLWRTGSRKSAAAPAPAVLYQRPYLAGGWEKLSRAAVVWRRARG